MEITIRDSRPGDSSSMVRVYRDAMDTLRKSRGGLHPDEEIGFLTSRPDDGILHQLAGGSAVVVAQSDEGEVVGIGAISIRLKHRLLGSTYSKNHYVIERCQRGRCGVSIGSMLREATIRKAKERGFRKLYGYATPESIGFHKRFGAVFMPYGNAKKNGVEYHYYELVLRDSPLNILPVELLFAELSPLARFAERLRDSILRKGKPKPAFIIGKPERSEWPRILEVLGSANMHHIPSVEMPELDLSMCFVAKVQGRIVGIGGYRMISPGIGKTTVLVVEPQYRGLGIGKALQLRRMEAMASLGARKIITNADLPESIAWYKKNFNYIEVGKLKKIHEFGNPVIGHWTTLELVLKGD